MPHAPESEFIDAVADWFSDQYGAANVSRQVYQPGPRWYCDLVVHTGYATLYIETESRAGEIRNGLAQALGYCAADLENGIPIVITPAGHIDSERVLRLQQSTTAVIREFDADAGEFV